MSGDATEARLGSYREFWPFYVMEHADANNRRLHFAGTTCVIALFLLAPAVSWWLLAAVPVAGYGFAWAGHFFFERNRPATFRYPLWSLVGDFQMYALMWRGKMGAVVERIAAEAAGALQ